MEVEVAQQMHGLDQWISRLIHAVVITLETCLATFTLSALVK